MQGLISRVKAKLQVWEFGVSSLGIRGLRVGHGSVLNFASGGARSLGSVV